MNTFIQSINSIGFLADELRDCVDYDFVEISPCRVYCYDRRSNNYSHTNDLSDMAYLGDIGYTVMTRYAYEVNNKIWTLYLGICDDIKRVVWYER